MLGPSSSGTAGMARIGAVAHAFLTAPLRSIHMTVTPRFETGYVACRSHFALIGGAMGLVESDSDLRRALDIAKQRDIALSYSVFSEPVPQHMLTVRLELGMENGDHCSLTAISIGGGSISVLVVDDYPVALPTSAPALFLWTDRPLQIESLLPAGEIQHRRDERGEFYRVVLDRLPDPAELEALWAVEGVRKAVAIPPILPLGSISHKPLFTTYAQLLALSETQGEDLADLAIAYEINRSSRSREAIWAQMADHWAVMKESVREGLTRPIQPLCGFNKGDGGKRLYKASREGRAMGGATLSRAIAYALAAMEYSMSLGRVVAEPTGGSCGIIPGCFLAVQEDRGFTDEEVISALFICAAVGVVMHYHGVSFSGSQGGCQGEVGVSSAMAAGGLAYLSASGPNAVVQGVALAMKHILGLICDPLQGCDEIPCIKRNGLGVANAFSGADMAIAGISSFIPPDEAMESLVEVQRIMPVELRGSGCGARSTRTGLAAEQQAMELQKDILLPRKEPSRTGTAGQTLGNFHE